MAYTKTNWVNGSSPAINATNLNKIEQGIYDAAAKADAALPASSFNPAAYATAAQGAKADAALPSEDFTDTNILNLLSETLETEFNIGPSLNIEELNIRIGNEVSNGKMFLSVAIGNLAAELLDSVSTNTQNVFLGYKTGQAAQISQGTYIGARARASASGVKNEIAIGQNTQGRGSHTAQIGNDNLTNIYYGPGTGTAFTNISDRRLKEEIEDADIDICYADIKFLPLHRFKYKDFVGNEGDQHLTGFIADEFEKVFPKAVKKNDKRFNVLKDGEILMETVEVEVNSGIFDENGKQIMVKVKREQEAKQVITDCASIDTSQIVPTLLGAVQKLMEKVERLEAEVALLKP